MSMTRPRYPSGFREQMVELVRSGRSPEELAGSSSRLLSRSATGSARPIETMVADMTA